MAPVMRAGAGEAVRVKSVVASAARLPGGIVPVAAGTAVVELILPGTRAKFSRAAIEALQRLAADKISGPVSVVNPGGVEAVVVYLHMAQRELLLLAVFEIEAQHVADRLEGEFIPGDLLFTEQGHFQ